MVVDHHVIELYHYQAQKYQTGKIKSCPLKTIWLFDIQIPVHDWQWLLCSGVGRIAVTAMLVGKMLMLVSICDSAFGNIGWDEGKSNWMAKFHFQFSRLLHIVSLVCYHIFRKIWWRKIWSGVWYKDTGLRTYVHESSFSYWTTIFLDAWNHCSLTTNFILHCLHFSQTKSKFCHWWGSL